MTDKKEKPSPKSEEEFWEHIDVNDCNYLLRTLEREAFTSVVNALRAKGPPSEHTFLLLDHLKSALSISDEMGRAEVRRAAFDPKLSKVAHVLNPHYDTMTEWSGSCSDPRGDVEAGPCRAKPFANTSTLSIADQLLQQASTRNEKLNRSNGRALELLSLPHKPFVPERLRMLLRETDRPEERIRPPLDPLPLPRARAPAPVPVEASADATADSEVRPPPAKKRRHRTSKAGKGKENPPELVPEEEAGPSSSTTPAAAASAAPAACPSTPVAAASASTVAGSTGSVIISPGQPPQSGDAMKTWEAEVAASAKKNGEVLSHVDTSTPSTSYATAASSDEPARKKRRSKSALDPYYLNSCARTRPFIFEKEDKASGKPKPPRGHPDTRSSPAPSADAPIREIREEPSTSGPRPVPVETHKFHSGNGQRNGLYPPGMEHLVASIHAKAAAAGWSPIAQTPSKKPPIPAFATPSRPQPRYFVNSSGVAVVPAAGSMSAVKAPSGGGMGGRTASLGSQGLAPIVGFQFGTQKASSSNSNSSVNSSGGGSTGSGIGPSSSSSSVPSADPPQPATALPPEIGGHDYAAAAVPNGLVQDPTGGLRLAPRGLPRPRVTPGTPARPSLVRSPGLPPNHFGPLNGFFPPPQPPLSLPPMLQLQRSGSLSALRPRLGSFGRTVPAAPAASAAPVVPTGQPVTDGMVQATVQNIMIETAQKECANGKRSTVLMRENGVGVNHPSPTPSSLQPVQPTPPTLPPHSYAVCRPSTSSDAAASTSSMMVPHNQPLHPALLKSTPLACALPPPPPPPTTVCTSLLSQPSALSSMAPGPSTGLGPSSSFSTCTLPPPPPPPASLPPTNPPAAPPNDPVVQHVRNFLMQINRESLSGTTTIFNQVTKNIAKNVVPDPPQQQQQQQQPPAAAAAPPPPSPAAPPRPAQRQYMLKPQGLPGGCAEFNLDNPMSYKSLASDGALVQYGVSPEELYDQGVLARPSTSGGAGGGGGGGSGSSGGTRAALQQSQPPPPPLDLGQQTQQAAATAAARLGVPSSFSIPSTSGGGGVLDNRETPSTSGSQQSPPQPSPLQQTPSAAAAAAATPPREGNASADVQDILEQSCRELR